MPRRYGPWTIIALTWLACACSRDSEGIGRVKGTITLDGKPLENAIITFQPDQGRPSTTRSDSQGRYVMEYTVRTPGALVGRHTVYIRTAMEAAPDMGIPGTREFLPAKYHDNSKLTAEVKAGANVIDFALTTD